MKKVFDWHLPEYDTHYEEWMKFNNETSYQRLQREFALGKVKNFKTVLDIGGNVGFWSRDFCEKFERVHIFEPDRSNLECLKMNLKDYDNYNIYEVGLGKQKGVLDFFISPTVSGGHSFFEDQVFEDNLTKTQCEVHVLDDYNFVDVDLIKIDTQGSELDILLGAKNTLSNNNPILNVEIEHKNEQQRQRGKEIVKFLNDMGYSELGRSRKKEVVFGKV